MNAAQPLVAHVVFRFGVGGLENGIVNLVNHLSRDRWRHAIVSLTDICPEFVERIAHRDVCYIALGKRPGHLLREYPELLRVFRSLRPAIVHTRNLAALEAVVPAWAARVPVRIHGEHGWDTQDPAGRRRRYRLARRLYRPFVSRYIALSRHLAGYLERQVGVPDRLISQIYNGVDTARFFPAAGTPAPIAGCPFRAPDHWLIGSVGRLEGIKDPLNLVRAFVRTLAMRPAAATTLRLVVAGDGALKEQAESVLSDAGVSNTILEAMATRLPVVATRVGGNVELIESGMTGTLVPSAHPDALARAILDYFGDRATAHRHAKAAHRVAETRFSLATMVATYASVYERALTAAGVALPSLRDGIGAPLASPESPSLQRASLP